MVMYDEKATIEAKNDFTSVSLDELESKKVVAKKDLKRVNLGKLPQHLPELKNTNETKDSIVAKWLSQWIEKSITDGNIQVGNLLPTKQELSQYLGVSIGTVQNAIRYIEDQGFVESKQRIGTMITGLTTQPFDLRKQISKRDIAIVAIKDFILKNTYQAGDALPSSRELAKHIGSAPNTTRLALENLASTGVIDNKGNRGNKANWILREVPLINNEESSLISDTIATDTLVDQVERDLKKIISTEYVLNQKIPAHFELSERLKVSIKTIHDAMKRLTDQGIIKSKRGRYGTIVVRMPSHTQIFTKESSIFAPASEASLYNYEKVEKHLSKMIKDNYKVGDKLPAMGKLSEELKVSSNTIRKALQNLSEKNIVSFSRGRYGGTFVTNMPKEEFSQSFTWLSVNPEHIAAYHSKTNK